MNSAVVIGVLAFLVATYGGQTALAQTGNDAFMLVPGVPGDALDEPHRGWIEVLSI
jgi:hypothetical protein